MMNVYNIIDMVGYKTTTNLESESDRLLNAVAAVYLRNRLPKERDPEVLGVLHSMLRRFFRAATPGSGLEHVVLLELANHTDKEPETETDCINQRIDKQASRLFGKEDPSDGKYQIILPDGKTYAVCRITGRTAEDHREAPEEIVIRYRYIGEVITEAAQA